MRRSSVNKLRSSQHNVNITNQNQSSGASGMPVNSTRKTGICVSKCYQMLCGRCGKRFASKYRIEGTDQC